MSTLKIFGLLLGKNKFPASGDSVDVNSAKLINVADPTAAQHAATKNYVDTRAYRSVYLSTDVTFSPAASTTYHIGATGVPRTTDTDRDSYWSVTGTIVEIILHHTNGVTNASAGNITYTFHDLTSAVDTSIGTASATQGAQQLKSTDFPTLSIAVTKGHLCTIKMDCPAWATPPAGCTWFFEIVVQLP